MKIRQGSRWIQRRYADRYTHRKRVMWCIGVEEMAIRCVERRRNFSKSHGIRRRTRVIENSFILTTCDTNCTRNKHLH